MTATEHGPVPDGAARPGLATPPGGPPRPGTAPPRGPVTAPGASTPPDDGADPRAEASGAVGPGDAPVRARAMRASSVVSEAWRNVATGTTRAALFAAVLVVVVGSLAAVDVRAVVGVIEGAREYRDAGASVQILEAPGQVDGARCEALTGVDGINAAGALRVGSPLRALNLPSSELTGLEATPGLLGALDRGRVAGAGLWLSADLAEALGVTTGDSIATNAGPARVGAVYPYPDDGRDRALGYAAVAPVPATGLFDSCWVEIWPVDPETAILLRTALVADPSSEAQPTQKQLNGRLGATYDASAEFADRLTKPAPVAAVVLGLALGLVAIRLRRLELAAALHARVPRAALTWQVLLETAVWSGVAVIVAVPALWWFAAGVGLPTDQVSTWILGMRTVLAGAGAVLIGAVAAALTTREKHLFKYFKER
ncbi:hypothetical protein [Oerskovia douganii]|uniref:hypothetical protein n=1 Tax=Oerskovia douganii TaxID=2762210 RepID=UPI001D0FD060|nr:hypothetical protein [Oerskovia douganii]